MAWFTFTNSEKLHKSLLNEKVSKNIHDQGKSLFCWAFAISTMLRQSLQLALSDPEYRKLNVTQHGEWLKKLTSVDLHRQLRNELIMLPIPKIKNLDIADQIDQGHYLDMAIQRVRGILHCNFMTFFYSFSIIPVSWLF